MVYARSTDGSLDEELYDDISDEDLKKKVFWIWSENIECFKPVPNSHSAEENQITSERKAADPLLNVARQFGSIATVWVKEKKNYCHTKKNSRQNNQIKSNKSSANSTQSFTCTQLLCARLRVKRHEFQEEMIRIYLECALNRFLE